MLSQRAGQSPSMDIVSFRSSDATTCSAPYRRPAEVAAFQLKKLGRLRLSNKPCGGAASPCRQQMSPAQMSILRAGPFRRVARGRSANCGQAPADRQVRLTGRPQQQTGDEAQFDTHAAPRTRAPLSRVFSCDFQVLSCKLRVAAVNTEVLAIFSAEARARGCFRSHSNARNPPCRLAAVTG
jgi:hypothetical protein